jgi:hypothetical protein
MSGTQAELCIRARLHGLLKARVVSFVSGHGFNRLRKNSEHASFVSGHSFHRLLKTSKGLACVRTRLHRLLKTTGGRFWVELAFRPAPLVSCLGLRVGFSRPCGVFQQPVSFSAACEAVPIRAPYDLSRLRPAAELWQRVFQHPAKSCPETKRLCPTPTAAPGASAFAADSSLPCSSPAHSPPCSRSASTPTPTADTAARSRIRECGPW